MSTELSKARVALETEENAPLIRLETGSGEVLRFTANNSEELQKHYRALTNAVFDARACKSIEKSHVLIQMEELQIADYDAMETLRSEFGTERVLGLERTRKLAFAELSRFNPIYRYIGTLYEMMLEYRRFCLEENWEEAYKVGSVVFGWMSNFELEEGTRTKRKGSGDVVDALLEEVRKECLEEDIRQYIDRLVTKPELCEVGKLLTSYEAFSSFYVSAEKSRGELFAGIQRSVVKCVDALRLPLLLVPTKKGVPRSLGAYRWKNSLEEYLRARIGGSGKINNNDRRPEETKKAGPH